MKRHSRSREEISRPRRERSCAFGAFADPSPKLSVAARPQVSTRPQGAGYAAFRFVAVPAAPHSLRAAIALGVLSNVDQAFVVGLTREIMTSLKRMTGSMSV